MNDDPFRALPRTLGPWLLLSEIRHRIANEYALAIGTISIAVNRTSDPAARAALSGAINRLLDYAAAHRALQAPRPDGMVDACDYLQEICGALVRSVLAEREISLTISSEPIELSADRCWRVGLIVFELITNAARHAFRDRGGAILVEMTRSGERVLCRVSNTGGMTTAARRGRGTEIVEALADELGGDINWVFGSRGASVLLSFPCDEAMAGREIAGSAPPTQHCLMG